MKVVYEKFAAAMRKFEQLQRSFSLLDSDLLRELKTALARPGYKERFVIKAKGGVYLLEASRAAYIQIQIDTGGWRQRTIRAGPQPEEPHAE
jgi:hypothetical protein